MFKYFMIKQITIIGLGLIGGSIAYAMKHTDFCQRIIAYDPQIDALKKAKQLGIIDGYETTVANAAKNSDFILIATPLSEFDNILHSLHQVITSETIITDVGSVKMTVIESAQPILKEKFSQFVPGHPIAGSEKSGFDAATADLFKNHLVVLTPNPITSRKSIEIVKLFWEKMQARVQIIDADFHDQILAITSHLPQLLAYTYMNQIANQPNFPQILNYTGNGFKDFTRIAASNPDIWIDICITNREAILNSLEHFKTDLNILQNALESQNKETLREIFTRSCNTKKLST